MIFAIRVLPLQLFTVLAIGLAGCSKSTTPDPAPRTRTELLTAPRWKITGYTTFYSKDNTTVDGFTNLDACDKDDLLQFTTVPSNTYSTDKGTVRCNPDANGGYEGTWVLDTNETNLVLNPGKSYEYRQKIQTLTDKQLVVQYEGRINNGTPTPGLTHQN